MQDFLLILRYNVRLEVEDVGTSPKRLCLTKNSIMRRIDLPGVHKDCPSFDVDHVIRAYGEL